MWRVSSQDYRGWRTVELDESHPPIKIMDFEDKRVADEYAAQERAAGLTACVTLRRQPRTQLRFRQMRIDDDAKSPFNHDWKLHR